MYVEQLFFPANRNFCGMMEKCTGGQSTDDSIILRIGFESWISTATNTHPEYVKHCFSTATKVSRTLSVALCVHYLSRCDLFIF
jgi:hypothetical protein